MWKKYSVAAAVSLACAVPSLAQESSSSDPDDTIIVHGARLAQPMTEVGSSVTVITAEDIEALNVDFVLDAIATAPGVSVNQNGSYGGVATIRIRGAAGEQTLVIVDGVVVNDPSSPGGGFNFARLDPANIERIEILRGPQSTLWGTDAMGGVINITTKQQTSGFGGRAYAQGGSFDTFRGGVDLGGATQQFDYRLSISSQSTDGISKADAANGNSEDDGYDATTISASAGYNFSNDARLQANVYWVDAEADFDSFVFGNQGNVGDGDESNTTEELSANLSLQLPLFDGRLENRFLIGMMDIDRANFSGGMPSFSSGGERTIYRYQGTVSVNDRNRVAFGLEREDSETDAGADTSIDGVFALYELQPSDRVTLTAGLRRDDHEQYGGETTARLAAAYNPTDQLTLSASWGEGFKAPSLFQTTFFCCGATAPNPNLRPERSDAYDVGVVWRTADARGEIGLTYFDQDTEDLITFSFLAGGYENIARANSTGFELSGSYQFTDWLRAQLNFTNIDATDGDGVALVRVPENKADLTLAFSPDSKLSGNLLVRYNGEEQDPNGDVASWTRVDLSGQYDITDTLELYARVENLFDEEYQQVLGYGTPGRSGYLGIRLSF